MCGRYTNLTPVRAWADLFGAPVPEWETSPRYNVAPSDAVLACRTGPRGDRELAVLRWGLVPAWSRGPSTGPRPINARAETVAEKPMFREALRRRRCLVAADGFYEWKAEGRRKQPWYFRRREARPFAFAGLWELWRGAGGEVLETCALLVTEANALVAPVHDRMPVILAPERFDRWLDPDELAPDRLAEFLRPFPPEDLEAYPVSPAVNRPGAEGPELIRPLGRWGPS